jgi:hypothetical protein
MSSSITLYGRQLLFGLLFTPDTVSNPTDLYCTLSFSVPSTSADGTALAEPAGGYARVQVPLDSSWWAPTGYGEITTVQDIVFPVFTVDQGLIIGWGLTDTATLGEGNLVACGSIANPYTGDAGNQPVVTAGDIMLALYD